MLKQTLLVVIGAALTLLWSTGAAAGPGDPYNGIDVSLIDKSVNRPGALFHVPDISFTNTLPQGTLAVTFPAGTTAGSQTRSLTTALSPLTEVQVVYSNPTWILPLGGTGPLSASLTLNGVWTVRGLGGLTLAQLGLSAFGGGGTVSATGTVGTFVLVGGPWTTGTAVITGFTDPIAGGTGPGTISAAGFDNRTAGGLGTLQLVTPVFVQTPIGQDATFAAMTLSFVPEPSALTLLGAGTALALALGVLARRR